MIRAALMNPHIGKLGLPQSHPLEMVVLKGEQSPQKLCSILLDTEYLSSRKQIHNLLLPHTSSNTQAGSVAQLLTTQLCHNAGSFLGSP